MWLEAKKRVPKILIDDWVYKGHTNLNIFSVFGEQVRNLSSKQSKLNFETNYTQKLHFYAVSGHKQPPDDQTIQFWHQVSKQFWKLWSTRFFWDQAYGGSEFFINGGRFFQRERVLWGWLAGPFLNSFYRLEVMAVQSLSYKIALCLLLTKYARRWANVFSKTLKILENHSLGIDTIFATMSDPPTPNL